jgi:hypothetical protein
MANAATNALEIQVLKDTLALLISNSKQPKDGTTTTTTDDDTLFPVQNTGQGVRFIRKADFLITVFGSIRRISDTTAENENTAVNQLVMGSKSGINGGGNFIGTVVFYPPTQDSHINFMRQF